MRSTQKTNDMQLTTVSETRKSCQSSSKFLSYKDVCDLRVSGHKESLEYKEFTKVGDFYVHRSLSSSINIAARFREHLIDLDITFYFQTLRNPTDKNDIYHLIYVTKHDFKKWSFKLAENISSNHDHANSSSTRSITTSSSTANNNERNIPRGAVPKVLPLPAINYEQSQFTNMSSNMGSDQTHSHLNSLYPMQPPYLTYDPTYYIYGYYYMPPQIPAYDQMASRRVNANPQPVTQPVNSVRGYSNNAVATNVASNPHTLFSSNSNPDEGTNSEDLLTFLEGADQIDLNDPMFKETLDDLMSVLDSGKTNPER